METKDSYFEEVTSELSQENLGRRKSTGTTRTKLLQNEELVVLKKEKESQCRGHGERVGKVIREGRQGPGHDETWEAMIRCLDFILKCTGKPRNGLKIGYDII